MNKLLRYTTLILTLAFSTGVNANNWLSPTSKDYIPKNAIVDILFEGGITQIKVPVMLINWNNRKIVGIKIRN